MSAPITGVGSYPALAASIAGIEAVNDQITGSSAAAAAAAAALLPPGGETASDKALAGSQQNLAQHQAMALLGVEQTHELTIALTAASAAFAVTDAGQAAEFI